MSMGTVADPRPLLFAGWRDALAALMATAVVVLAGEAFGAAVAEAILWTFPALDETVPKAAAAALICLYQIALVWFFAGWWFGTDRRQALGLGDTRVAAWVWPAAIAGLYALKALVSIAVLMAVYGTGTVALGATSDAVAPFADVMRSHAWLLMVGGGILAAVLEELLYRGYLSRILEASRLGFWPGALLAALVWAGMHVYYPLPMQAMLVILGLALSWLRATTGSILPGMAWHIANNTIALLAMRLLV